MKIHYVSYVEDDSAPHTVSVHESLTTLNARCANTPKSLSRMQKSKPPCAKKVSQKPFRNAEFSCASTAAPKRAAMNAL